MHADEVETDAALVGRLVAAQLPQWAGLPIEPVASSGTDNALYRLGEELVARLPRIPSAVAQLDKEHRWLPELAPRLPLAVPVPLARGRPAEHYPWDWSVYPWLVGEDAGRGSLADPVETAVTLAGFIAALQRIDASAGPPPGPHNFFRGVPLRVRDAAVRDAIEALGDRVDPRPLTAAWEAALRAPVWARPPVWIHGDLKPENLILAEGRLHGVIDFGGLGVGDPACELIIAWSLFSAEVREVFRASLGVDDATWARGRGWSLSVALIALPYYMDTNPGMVRYAQHLLDEVIADPGA